MLIPEVISLDEPRPSPCVPSLVSIMSEGDWFAGGQSAKPQILSLWLSIASPSTEPRNKTIMMDL